MLKELSLLKWQQKATNLASEKTGTEVEELQAAVSNLEANVKIERCLCWAQISHEQTIKMLMTFFDFNSQGEN